MLRLSCLFLVLLLPLLPASAQLWVSSNFSHEVYRYNPVTGDLIGGGPFISASTGGLTNPHGILDIGSHLYVASFGSDEVKRFDRLSGAFVDNFLPNTTGLDQPVYLAIGPDDGLLYVTSQGNDRVLRFHLDTGAAADGSPFIDGGLLDGPSGLAWSNDGSVLYVAGRYSANVLAYDPVTGAALINGHQVITGLGAGTTFGLQVDPASGDLLVASDSDVHRYSTNGTLVTTMITPGLDIGLELEGGSVVSASNNTLYPIDRNTHAVGGAFLNGGSINVLNFFHFSRNPDPVASSLDTPTPYSDGTHIYPTISIGFSLFATNTTAMVQFSEDLDSWTDGAVYRPDGTNVVRTAGASVNVSVVVDDTRVTVVERDDTPTGDAPGYLRVRFDTD